MSDGLTVPSAYFNPPTPWGVGLFGRGYQVGQPAISIHPLRGEWDSVPP